MGVPDVSDLIEHLPVGVYRTTPDGRVLMANPALVRMLGYPDLQSLTAVDLEIGGYGDQADRQRWRAAIERDGISSGFEVQWRRHDGTTLWVCEHARAVRDGEGRVLYYEGVVEDVTQRKRAEAELLERIRLASLTAGVCSALARGDALSEFLRRCVELMVQHLGLAFARIWTLSPPENALDLQASAGLYTHIDGPHRRILVGQSKIGIIAQERRPHLTNQVIGDPHVQDQEWARKEGMRAFAGYPLIAEDRMVGVMAMFSRQPLTDFAFQAMAPIADSIALAIREDRVGRALRESEDRYRDLVEHSHDLICTHDLDGRLLSVNRAAVRLMGFEPEEMVGMNIRDGLAPEVRGKFDAYLTTLRTHGAASGLMIVLTRSGERRIWEYDNTVRTEGVGSPVVRGLARDITDRLRADRERDKLIRELQEAVSKAKTLSGLLPICASCKKIRDDRGYWNRIESYIADHSEAEFSHGICPECFNRLYPEYREGPEGDSQTGKTKP
ncbi:MAG: PAS domain S-box protein [Acidobacteriota bacterium]